MPGITNFQLLTFGVPHHELRTHHLPGAFVWMNGSKAETYRKAFQMLRDVLIRNSVEELAVSEIYLDFEVSLWKAAEMFSCQTFGDLWHFKRAWYEQCRVSVV